jgi:hypothetical protein
MARQHGTRSGETESGCTEGEDHDYVACHARAMFLAADANVLCVESEGCVEDDCGNADSSIGIHGVWCRRTRWSGRREDGVKAGEREKKVDEVLLLWSSPRAGDSKQALIQRAV